MGKSIVGPREQTLGYAFNARAPMPVGALKERARPCLVAPRSLPFHSEGGRRLALARIWFAYGMVPRTQFIQLFGCQRTVPSGALS